MPLRTMEKSVAPYLLLVASALADPGVTLEVQEPRPGSGQQLRVVVENASGGPIFVPPCETMQVESFDEVLTRWIPQQSRTCGTSAPATALAEGEHVLETTISVDQFRIVRLVLAYGQGCHEGFPLELADCTTHAAAVSRNMPMTPPPEE